MKSTLPLVSVAMATYNGERFLREQLNSIYNQTYKNIEVIVTDDCSTDATVEILEEYKSQYGLNYFINSQRLGLVKNFEKAISLCQGEFIALSDQDDIWKPEKLKTLVTEIESYTLIYSVTLEYIDKNSLLISVKIPSEFYEFILCFGTGTPTQKLIAHNWIASHQILFRKELLKVALPIPINQYYHDRWIVICASKLNGIKFLPKSLMYYRQHEDSFTYPKLGKSTLKTNQLFKQTNSHQDLKSKAIKHEIARLNDLLHFLPLLDRDEKDLIENLIIYYQSRLNHIFSLKALLTTLKYGDLFITKRQTWEKLKFVLSALIV